MKHVILMILLLCATVLSLSASLSLALKPGIPEAQRYDEIRAMQDSGIEIYHFNQDNVLAGINPQKHSGFELLSAPKAGQKLYLIQNSEDLPQSKLEAHGSIIKDLGTDILYGTPLDPIELREICPAYFLPLHLEGIILPERKMQSPAQIETRQEIEQLVSQVSADSVLFFIQSLQDMGTRYALADNRYDVSVWIRDTFARFGLDTQLQEFNFQTTQQYNVIAEIPGTIYPDEYIVVGGHHDSITYTTPYSFAPGADDNASGAAAALEIARVLAAANYQPKSTIRFVTYAAEEFGLHGSYYDAWTAYSGDMDIRLMINHDMIANNNPGTSTVRLMPYDGAMEQSAHAQYLTSAYTDLEAIYGIANSHSSDSYSYWNRGYPVIYFFETDFSPYYHSDADLVANIDHVYCAEVIRASLASTVSFANMPGAVQNLVVEDVGDGSSLRISWDMPADPEADHVRVYYGTGDPTLNDPVLVYDQSFHVISGLSEGVTYNVAVSVADAEGNESYFAYASGTSFNTPQAPTGFVANPTPGGIKLSWEPNTEMDLGGYRLWRADDATAQFQMLHSEWLTEEQYQDTNVVGAVDQYYYYRVQALDTDGNDSAFSSIEICRPATFDNGVVVVDATIGGSGINVLLPTDQQVNDYYDAILDHFDHHTLDLETIHRELKLFDLSIFSTVIWHDVDSSTDVLPEQVRTVLEEYIAMGGNLIYNGYFPTKALMGNDNYATQFAEDDFINRVLGVISVDYFPQSRMNAAMSLQDDLEDLHVGEHASLEGFNYHIMKVEGMWPADGAQKYYSYLSDYPSDSPYSTLSGTGVGIYNPYLEGQSLVLSFPLYVIQEDDARQMLYDLLHVKWGETVSGDDPTAPSLTGLSLQPNYPNPFQTSTLIRLKGAEPSAVLEIKIYNLRGQLIRTLYQGKAQTDYQWDGRDNAGNAVSSGIYFVRAAQAGRFANRKIIRMK